MSRRILCPVPGYEAVAVILPDTWLGSHLYRRDEAVRVAAESKNSLIISIVLALALCEGVENCPGLESEDPTKWEFQRAPLAVLYWLQETVISDFNTAFKVPKASSSPPSAGLEATAKTTNPASMAGDLAARP